MDAGACQPDDVLEFWFPDGPEPDPVRHGELWRWRMLGGAHEAVTARFSDLTAQAAAGEFDHWALTPRGRMALIVVLDQFPRSVWRETPRAFAQDPKALALCLEGLENGHYDALENAWYKATYLLPMTHCECADHLAYIDRAVELCLRIEEEAPERLRDTYRRVVQQTLRHRAVIAAYGRHPHRNPILGRPSTPEEEAYIARGDFPHKGPVRTPAQDQP